MSCPEEDGMLVVDAAYSLAHYNSAELRLNKEAGRATLRQLDLDDMASSVDFNVRIDNFKNYRGGDQGYNSRLGAYVLFDRPLSEFTLEQNNGGMWVPPLDVAYANPLVLEEFIQLVARHASPMSLLETEAK